MMKNKDYFLEKLQKQTGRPMKECVIINDILDSHFIIGHNNKDKIKNDFMEKLNISDNEANKLYNICSGIIVKSIFKRKQS